MDGNDYYTEYYSMVKQVALEYSKKYRMVERSDIEQELWLWFVSHPNKTSEWIGLEDRKDGDKLFAKSLRNAALDYCIKEKARVSGYDPADNFYYSKSFIKTTLPAVLSNDWTKLNNVLAGLNRTPKALSESNDWIAYSSDIWSAYNKLGDEAKLLVYYFYGEQLTGKELKETLSSPKSEKALMVEANRAINKMVKLLGGLPAFKDDDFSYGETKEDN
jgi:hypothetical protein